MASMVVVDANQNSNGRAARLPRNCACFRAASQRIATGGMHNLHVRMTPSPALFMATCPRCFGALTDNHKCPKGTFSRVTDAISTVGIGGIVGAVFVFLVEERPVGALVV